MKRRDFIKTGGGLILLAGATPWPEALAQTATTVATGSRPFNVLFLTADDMSGAMPGFMGNPLKPTPNMDAFAATAHRFVQNHGAAPICQPSREAFMTGLWPNRSGALGFNPVNDGTPTLATVLKDKGYFIAGLNKLEHMKPASCFPWDISHNDSGRNPPMVGTQVAEIIKAAQAAGKPFFLNCNLRDPHRPYYGTVPANTGGGIEDVAQPVTIDQITGVPSFLEDLPGVRDDMMHYTNSVQRLDLGIGAAMSSLQASGEMDRTIIVFVSDHGQAVPFSKVTCYKNGAWCPALMRWPGMGAPQERQELTQSIDIMPTLLDLLGVEKPDMDGRSWLPLLKGEKQDRDHVILNSNSTASGAQFPMRGVQTEKSALLVSFWSNGTNRFEGNGMDTFTGGTYPAMKKAAETDPRIKARVDQLTIGFPIAFYDLVADPDQRTNAIKDPAHAAEVKRLQDILMAYMVTTKDPQLENYKTILAGGTVNIDVKANEKGKKKSEG